MKLTIKVNIFPRMNFRKSTKIRQDKRIVNRSKTKTQLKKEY